MAKTRTIFICQQCGSQQSRWAGRCPDCGTWDSLVEQVERKESGSRGKRIAAEANQPVSLRQVAIGGFERLPVLGNEFARVLGGGLVPGSLVLIGGDPGIGKCLAATSRVFDPTSGALLSITEWATRMRPVLALDPQTYRLYPQRVSAFHDQGLRSVVELHTSLGRTLRCTPNHPVLTPQGWRHVEELAPGDQLAAPSCLPYFGNEATEPRQVRLIANALSDCAAYESAPDQAEIGACSTKTDHIAIPDSIFRLPKHQLALFLHVLFSRDGALYLTQPGLPGVSFRSASRRLAEDVQHLLLRFGCIAQLQAKKAHGAPWTAYALEMLGVAQVKRFLDVIGIQGSDEVKAAIEQLPVPQPPASSAIYWDMIEHILPTGQERVYDITVPDGANFVANDLIVHNSTLLTQVAAHFADQVGPALYVSAEESVQQIKLRASRMGLDPEDLLLYAETSLDAILEQIERTRTRLVVVDSIQTVYLEDVTSAAGSVSQVREGALRLLRAAKETGTPIFLVGHVTKEGAIAGPRVLEHIVDAVLYLEGERFHQYRLLRGVKNRFGSTNEVGVFEMTQNGMHEVANPSQVFLAERNAGTPGSAVAVTMEGTRPILVEIQALTASTGSAQPRRTANGFDMNRLLMLVAVLSKRVGLPLFNQDVYVNIVGGLRIAEPAADLAVAVAIVSSYRNQPVRPDMVMIGEVGLSGELRSISQIDRRLSEAAKLGFTSALVPGSGSAPKVEGLRIAEVRSLVEVIDQALDGEK